jgi:hypothetical protein
MKAEFTVSVIFKLAKEMGLGFPVVFINFHAKSKHKEFLFILHSGSGIIFKMGCQACLK